jgi:L-2-hydroxyglutarate oxidase LhgO
MNEQIRCKYTVIGAGVIGLAIARELAIRVKDDMGVFVVEKETASGTGVSSRNSEVIHSGIYYPTGSLKHKLCVEGRKMIYKYCSDKNIPHKKCGKLIVATSKDETESLENIFQQSKLNGIEGVVRLTKEEVYSLEPDVNAYEALLSKETGILNAHHFMSSLECDIKELNGTIVHGAEVIGLEHTENGSIVQLNDGTTFMSLAVINCAGLNSAVISKMLGLGPETIYPCKGSYFYYSGKHDLKHLIYPVPEKKLTGLGVHATLDLNGRLKFGPDTEYTDKMDDFTVDAGKKEKFFVSAKKLLKGLDPEKLLPDMAGVRPKIQGPNEAAVKDFYIKEEKYKGFINLIGMESPGLTSSLAIGRYVADMLVPH